MLERLDNKANLHYFAQSWSYTILQTFIQFSFSSRQYKDEFKNTRQKTFLNVEIFGLSFSNFEIGAFVKYCHSKLSKLLFSIKKNGRLGSTPPIFNARKTHLHTHINARHIFKCPLVCVGVWVCVCVERERE